VLLSWLLCIEPLMGTSSPGLLFLSLGALVLGLRFAHHERMDFPLSVSVLQYSRAPAGAVSPFFFFANSAVLVQVTSITEETTLNAI
jgi:hypothetical protein